MVFLCTICEIELNYSKSYGFVQYWWTNFIVGTFCFTAHMQYCSIAESSQFIYNNLRSSACSTFNIWRYLAKCSKKTIRFGMVYVDFTKHTKRNHISSNFSFNTDISWRLSIPGAQGCGRISRLLSEILFCRPLINKKKIQINFWKTLEAT